VYRYGAKTGQSWQKLIKVNDLQPHDLILKLPVADRREIHRHALIASNAWNVTIK